VNSKECVGCNKKPAEEVIIRHNSRTECAKESLKTSSYLETATHFFRYVARTCDITVTSFWEKLAFHIAKKVPGFYSKRREAETKHVVHNVST